ncbi:MAG TPA: LPS biosynthesis choline kinase [Rhodospirillales bacterium]|nr:LPS biosynthesis choline kinase [Rhodospirillales bacterium]
MEEARAALARIPCFADRDLEAATFERLGGLTNRVYRVDIDGERFCLRIPGKGTEDYIDRRVEATNARAAAEAGISPEMLYFDEASGLMLTRFLDGVTTMTPERFASVEGAVERAARTLRRLHRSGRNFAFHFELFSMIDDYLGVIAKRGAALPDGYHEVVAEAEAVREALAAHPAALAPCHCDPVCENFLDTGERMWIVDWEYSGMNDPMWDLGDLSVEASFTPEQDERLLNAYFGGPPEPFDRGRMVVYKAMCDLLWTLWGLIQHADGNPAEDFWAYALGRFERCRALMATAAFREHLEAVRRGPRG